MKKITQFLGNWLRNAVGGIGTGLRYTKQTVKATPKGFRKARRFTVWAYKHPNWRNEFVHYTVLLACTAMFWTMFTTGAFQTPIVARLPADVTCRPLTAEEMERAISMASSAEGGGQIPSCYPVFRENIPYRDFEPFLTEHPDQVKFVTLYPELHQAIIQRDSDREESYVDVADPKKLATIAEKAFGDDAKTKLKIGAAEHVHAEHTLEWTFAFLLGIAFVIRFGASTLGRVADGTDLSVKAAIEDNDSDDEDEAKKKKLRVMFEDVAGCEEAIARLQRIVKWQKKPGLFRLLRARPPKGIMMIGPPGTGKTFLARALAGELGDVNLLVKAGSDFINKYVGVGAASVRGAFDELRKKIKKNGKMGILFIDEAEALGRKRSGDDSGGSSEHDTTVNQLLTEMDGFSPDEDIIVICATNRPEIMDPAVKRQGRIDYTISVDRPDNEGRFKLLKLKTKDKPLAADVDRPYLAKIMSGMVGADIQGVANEAAVLAAERIEKSIEEILEKLRADDPDTADKLSKALEAARGEETEELTAEQLKLLGIEITMADFIEAIDIVRHGDKLHSKQKNQLHNEQYNTAIHEGGHAAVCTEVCKDPVDKVSRMMRSKSLGMVQVTPEADTYGYTEEWLRGQIMMAFGGCLAQEIILGVRDSGLDSDLAQASKLARYMVGRWGMSKKFGKISLTLNEEGYPACYISETLRAKFDECWNAIIEELYDRAEKLVFKIQDKIVYSADVLMDEETQTGDRFREVYFQTPPAARKNSSHLRDYFGSSDQLVLDLFPDQVPAATAAA